MRYWGFYATAARGKRRKAAPARQIEDDAAVELVAAVRAVAGGGSYLSAALGMSPSGP